MTFNFKLFTLLSCLLFVGLSVKAQDKNDDKKMNRHAINISYSDGLTLGGASFWGMGLSDVITGTERTDQRSSGVLGLGYRYTVKKWFKAGLELGFAQTSSKVTYGKDQTPSVNEKELNLLIMPTLDFVYFKRNLFELYGSAAAGLNLTRHYEKGLTDYGKEMAQNESKLGKGFCYQVNPIALRVGNDRVGGFVEAGLGYRGFITAGVSVNF